jgi:hypothetical protein
VLEKLGLVFERELVFAGIPAVCYGLSRAAYLARGSDAPAGRAAS